MSSMVRTVMLFVVQLVNVSCKGHSDEFCNTLYPAKPLKLTGHSHVSTKVKKHTLASCHRHGVTHGSVALAVPGLYLKVVSGAGGQTLDAGCHLVPYHSLHHPVSVPVRQICSIRHHIAWNTTTVFSFVHLIVWLTLIDNGHCLVNIRQLCEFF